MLFSNPLLKSIQTSPWGGDKEFNEQLQAKGLPPLPKRVHGSSYELKGYRSEQEFWLTALKVNPNDPLPVFFLLLYEHQENPRGIGVFIKEENPLVYWVVGLGWKLECKEQLVGELKKRVKLQGLAFDIKGDPNEINLLNTPIKGLFTYQPVLNVI